MGHTNRLDWHIKCDYNKKKCIFFEDEKEEHPKFEIVLDEDTGEIRINKISNIPGLEFEFPKRVRILEKSNHTEVLTDTVSITF